MGDRLDVIDWSIAWYGMLENSLPMSWNLFLALLPLGLSCELFHRPRSPIVHGGIWFLVIVTLLPHVNRLTAVGVLLIDWFGIVSLMAIAVVAILFGVTAFAILGYKPLQTIIWWVGCLVCLLFLPNAAYVLTDVIHFVLDVRKGYPMGTLIVVLLPQYLLFIATGFQAYVAALMNVGYFLTDRQQATRVIWVELGLHGLAAIAIYLGRFTRFNSWDVIADPIHLLQTIGAIATSRHNCLIVTTLFLVVTGCYWICKRITIGLLAQERAF